MTQKEAGFSARDSRTGYEIERRCLRTPDSSVDFPYGELAVEKRRWEGLAYTSLHGGSPRQRRTSRRRRGCVPLSGSEASSFTTSSYMWTARLSRETGPEISKALPLPERQLATAFSYKPESA